MSGAENRPSERKSGEMQKIREGVTAILERQEGEVRRLGELLARAFGQKGKTQVSNLEQVALNAETFAEVEAWVKRQVGLSGEQSDRKPWKEAGNDVLRWLRSLREAALGTVNADSEARSMEFLLRAHVPSLLLGTACRWLHSEYLYRVQAGAGSRDGGGRR